MKRRLLPGLALVLAACSTGGPVPEDRFYELNPVPPARIKAVPVLSGGVSVARVVADPLRNGRAILYRDPERPHQLLRYHYAFWVDQPPRLVQAALVDALRASGIADRVEAEGLRTHFRFSLEADLRRFEVWQAGSGAVAGLEVEFILRHNRDGRTLWRQAYRSERPVAGNNTHAIAVAMAGALENLLRDTMDGLGGMRVIDPPP